MSVVLKELDKGAAHLGRRPGKFRHDCVRMYGDGEWVSRSVDSLWRCMVYMLNETRRGELVMGECVRWLWMTRARVGDVEMMGVGSGERMIVMRVDGYIFSLLNNGIKSRIN